MPLKYKCKTKDEIPAEHPPLYAEREGAWVLDVDGAVEKTKLDEFRNTNVALIKERDDLKRRYEGIDSDAVKSCPKGGGKRRQASRIIKLPHGPWSRTSRVWVWWCYRHGGRWACHWI
jgi:hypothetical protein